MIDGSRASLTASFAKHIPDDAICQPITRRAPDQSHCGPFYIFLKQLLHLPEAWMP
jgi:hypothetical protein